MCSCRVTSRIRRFFRRVNPFYIYRFCCCSRFGDTSKKYIVNPSNKMIINYTDVSKDHCIIHDCAVNLKINMSFDVTQSCISIVSTL